VLMVMANSMSLQARKIDPLVAVLNSVWLNFHVTSLLISYSCFLMAFVTGILFLIKDMTGNRPGMLPRAETFEFITYRCVQIGWPLLTLGIFLGAVWANTAWGSFWSWDPKETWALITWLTYTIYLHLRINLGWHGRKSIYASMIGFVMVLLTYFGVSYLPGLAGGMHSYAEPIQR
jgi:cytochrome c-type biogenesis protein CcsB